MLTNELYQRERHDEFARQAQCEAEQAQLLEGLPDAPHKPFYKPALAAIGIKLVALGNRLQDNVEPLAPMNMLPVSKQP